MKKNSIDPRSLVGKTVTWTSQARGNSTIKTGEILGFVPAWNNIKQMFLFLTELSTSQYKIDASTSQIDRYLVRVRRFSQDGQKELKPWYYAPRANPSLFTVVEESSNEQSS